MPIIIPAPTPPGVELEEWILDGLALNDGTLSLESITDNPASKKPEWISGADSDGAILGRAPTYENKVIEMRLRVNQQATMDAAVAHIGSILDKLQECERNPDGLPLVWDPAGSTADQITWRCLLGEITDLPKSWQGDEAGWWVLSPVLTIRLTCLPIARGEETQLATVTSSDPLVTLELANVPGDVPALGRLVVTDEVDEGRRYMAWGIESRHYPTSNPPALLIDSGSLMTTGYTGSVTTRTGAYSASGVVRSPAPLVAHPTAMCATASLGHVGTFRVLARTWATYTNVTARLCWRSGDGPWRSNPWVSAPLDSQWGQMDFGSVTIREASNGIQSWTGRIEVQSNSAFASVFDIDYLALLPTTEGFGLARAPFRFDDGSLVGYDNFDTYASGNLEARAAGIGGAWATAGSIGDFQGSGTTATRAVTADTGAGRFALLGTTDFEDTSATVSVYVGAVHSAMRLGVVARWDNSSNFINAYVLGDLGSFFLEKTVAGVGAQVRVANYAHVNDAWYTIRLTAYTTGRVIAQLFLGETTKGMPLALIDAYVAEAESGGALSSGKPGFMDKNASTDATPRIYNNFIASAPPPENFAIQPGQSAEIRYDSAIREDVTGALYGDVPYYVGSRFNVPNAGGPGRKSRVAVLARRNDVQVAADDNIADSLTVAVYAAPGYLAIPR